MRFPCICWIQIVWFWKKEKAKSWWTFLAVVCLHVYMGWSKILGMTTLKHESFALISIGPGVLDNLAGRYCTPHFFQSPNHWRNTPTPQPQQTKTALWSKAQKHHLNRHSPNILIGTCAVGQQENWLVVSNVYVHPYLGRFPFWLIFFRWVETTNTWHKNSGRPLQAMGYLFSRVRNLSWDSMVVGCHKAFFPMMFRPVKLWNLIDSMVFVFGLVFFFFVTMLVSLNSTSSGMILVFKYIQTWVVRKFPDIRVTNTRIGRLS